MSTHSWSAAALLLLLLFSLQAHLIDGERQRKLVRAPRETRVESNYFVHMKDNVTAAQMESFAQSLERQTTSSGASGAAGYEATVHGYAYTAAHGFTAHLSGAALEKVTAVVYIHKRCADFDFFFAIAAIMITVQNCQL